jgi:quercetin dioxygenase-like cupin family protein
MLKPLCLIGLLLLTPSPPTHAAAASGVVVENLMQTSQSWDGTAYQRYPAGPPELTVLRITVPPRTALPWHTHPMPNAAYVVSGELLVEKQKDGATRRLVAGDVLPEMVGSVHRGVTGDAGVVLIVFYAGTKGMKLSE